MRKSRMLLVAGLAALLAACGGGSSDEQPSLPQPNRNPEAGKPVARLRVNAGQPVDLDLTAGGTAVRDPDGDPLIYMAEWLSQAPGLYISGARLTGTTTDAGFHAVRVTALDGRDGKFSYVVEFAVVQNVAPAVMASIAPRIVRVGELVDIDALQGGATFGADPQDDAVTYAVTLSPDAHGLAISGTRVAGVFASAGAVRARITATDVFGATSHMDFIVAAPGPEPARPVLPAVPYTYDPYRMALPPLMMPGREGGPLGDTTPANNPITNAGATLGRVLFYDRRLSSSNTHSCASCHQQSRGFANGDAFSTGAAGDRSRRNAMGLANVQFNPAGRFFLDQRVDSLERVVLMPIEDATELASSLAIVVPKLAATDFYPPLFEGGLRLARSHQPADRPGAGAVPALAEVVPLTLRSVPQPAGGPDRRSACFRFPPQASEGMALFSSLSCNSCHNGVLQTMRIPSSNGLDEVPLDPGAGGGRFRAASLRNIERTAPYMHDGRFAALREVIDHTITA